MKNIGNFTVVFGIIMVVLYKKTYGFALLKNTYEFFDVDCPNYKLIISVEFAYRSLYGKNGRGQNNDSEEANL